MITDLLCNISDAFRDEPWHTYETVDTTFPIGSPAGGAGDPTVIAIVPMGWEWRLTHWGYVTLPAATGLSRIELHVDGRRFSSLASAGAFGDNAIVGLPAHITPGATITATPYYNFAQPDNQVQLFAQFETRHPRHPG